MSSWTYLGSEMASSVARISLSRSGLVVGVALRLIGTLLGLGRVNTSLTTQEPSMSLRGVCSETCLAMVSRQAFSFGLAEMMRPFPT